jgi:hypothetical protein
LPRIGVAKSSSHQQSQSEIGSDNPCYQELSILGALLKIAGTRIHVELALAWMISGNRSGMETGAILCRIFVSLN